MIVFSAVEGDCLRIYADGRPIWEGRTAADVCAILQAVLIGHVEITAGDVKVIFPRSQYPALARDAGEVWWRMGG